MASISYTRNTGHFMHTRTFYNKLQKVSQTGIEPAITFKSGDLQSPERTTCSTDSSIVNHSKRFSIYHQQSVQRLKILNNLPFRFQRVYDN